MRHQPLLRSSIVAVLGLASAACGNRGDGGPATAAESPGNFELVCESIDTDQQSIEFCMRMDTRTGDVVRVDTSRIPRSAGPTEAPAGPPGTYQLVCDATHTATKSDLSCVRLNRVTGELLLIALPAIREFPEP